MKILLLGLFTGAMFGFCLQKGSVLRYDRQLGGLRLQDMTIFKFMLSAIVVAMVGTYLLKDLGLVSLAFKPVNLGGNIIGGLLFGLGWGMVGYCPGTSAGALGEGRWDALFAIFGMLLGASLYAEAYPLLRKTVLTWGNFGTISLPELLHINHWLVIIAFVIGVIMLCRWFEQKNL
jgi:hypothetical protein